MTLVYLDYNATAPLRPEVVAAMDEWLAQPANPSSVHGFGRRAKQVLDESRRTLASTISAFPHEVYFTASGTEANNWALNVLGAQRTLIVSASEHVSVLACARRYNAIVIAVDDSGVLNLDALERELKQHKAALVSVMLVNNETGVVQPVAEIAKLAKRFGALVHCDAVQALGKWPIDIGLLGVDALTLSAHKMGGPVGAAALVVRDGVALAPMMFGGGQEARLRPGTENVAAIAGFSKAISLADAKALEPLEKWLRKMEQVICEVSAGTRVAGVDANRAPNVSNLTMPGVVSETQLIDFDMGGYAISSGSACSSGRVEPSHVLLSMDYTQQEAGCAIRVSGGWATTELDILRFTEAWLALYKRVGQKAA